MIKREEKRKEKSKKVLLKVIGTSEKPRVCIYRSLDNIYLQFIDDNKHHTLFAYSNLTKGVSEKLSTLKGKVAKSKELGKLAATEAKSKKIENVVFDRNGFRYHGRVKALADGLREGGLKF